MINFVPSTPTEMMLHNHIKKLESQLGIMRKLDPNWADLDLPYGPIQVRELPEKLTLIPEARLIAAVEDDGMVRVRVDAYCKDEPFRFGSQYMVSEPTIRYHAGDMMIELHKQLMHRVAGLLYDKVV